MSSNDSERDLARSLSLSSLQRPRRPHHGVAIGIVEDFGMMSHLSLSFKFTMRFNRAAHSTNGGRDLVPIGPEEEEDIEGYRCACLCQPWAKIGRDS